MAALDNARLDVEDVRRAGIPPGIGELRFPVAALCDLSAAFMAKVAEVHDQGASAVSPAGQQLTVIAVSLFKASACTAWAAGEMELGDLDVAAFSRLASAFFSAHSVTKSVFARQAFIPDLSALYAGSDAKYSRANPFPAMFPADASLASVSGSAIQALLRLEAMDVVLSPPGFSQLLADVRLVSTEVRLI